MAFGRAHCGCRRCTAIWFALFAAGTDVGLHYDVQPQQDLGIDKTRSDVSSTIAGVDKNIWLARRLNAGQGQLK